MKYRLHKYVWSKSVVTVQHDWSFIGPLGGLNLHASISDYGTACGLEFHRSRSCWHQPPEAPSHTRCWLTDEPCWHEGTSLYATENIWPMVEPLLRDGNHEAIFLILEREADQHFAEFQSPAVAQ